MFDEKFNKTGFSENEIDKFYTDITIEGTIKPLMRTVGEMDLDDPKTDALLIAQGIDETQLEEIKTMIAAQRLQKKYSQKNKK